MQIYSCARRIIDTNIIDYSDCRATDYTAHALVTEDRIKGTCSRAGGGSGSLRGLVAVKERGERVKTTHTRSNTILSTRIASEQVGCAASAPSRCRGGAIY